MDVDKKILITGSNGFVGKKLYERLNLEGYDLLGATRDTSKNILNQKNIFIKSINETTDWTEALKDCKCVIHLAARVHKLRENQAKMANKYDIINRLGTLKLAEQAAESGVSKFIFLSSIGVNGISTNLDKGFNNASKPMPHSNYAISKFKAEQGLLEIEKNTKMKCIIIRSPAIYGIGAPGNFRLIEKLIKYNLPIPLNSITNKKSMIYIDNLIDFILKVIKMDDTIKQKIFLVSDCKDLSTPEIIKVVAKINNKKPNLYNFNLSLLSFIFKIIGHQKAWESLSSNLQISNNDLKKNLGWEPPFNPKSYLNTYD